MRENVFVILNECYNSCLCDCFVEKEVENVAFTAGWVYNIEHTYVNFLISARIKSSFIALEMMLQWMTGFYIEIIGWLSLRIWSQRLPSHSVVSRITSIQCSCNINFSEFVNFQTQLQQNQSRVLSNSDSTASAVSTATAASVSNLQNVVKVEQKPVECNLCHRKFKNIPALNGHMRLHGGYFKKDTEPKKCDKKETNGPPLQTASVGIRALIEEKIISKRGKDLKVSTPHMISLTNFAI